MLEPNAARSSPTSSSLAATSIRIRNR